MYCDFFICYFKIKRSYKKDIIIKTKISLLNLVIEIIIYMSEISLKNIGNRLTFQHIRTRLKCRSHRKIDFDELCLINNNKKQINHTEN